MELEPTKEWSDLVHGTGFSWISLGGSPQVLVSFSGDLEGSGHDAVRSLFGGRVWMATCLDGDEAMRPRSDRQTIDTS